jgi:hypothetical protein
VVLYIDKPKKKMSKKIKHRDGFIGCRTPKTVEEKLKEFCLEHTREVSEVMNYLCRLFIEDAGEIRTKFFFGALHEAREELTGDEQEIMDEVLANNKQREPDETDSNTELGMS